MEKSRAGWTWLVLWRDDGYGLKGGVDSEGGGRASWSVERERSGCVVILGGLGDVEPKDAGRLGLCLGVLGAIRVRDGTNPAVKW